jgi:hypothetical protein
MDTPEDADVYETKLRDGDLIIAYVGPRPSLIVIQLTQLCFFLDGRFDGQRVQSRDYLHLQSGVSVWWFRRRTGETDLGPHYRICACLHVQSKTNQPI